MDNKLLPSILSTFDEDIYGQFFAEAQAVTPFVNIYDDTLYLSFNHTSSGYITLIHEV